MVFHLFGETSVNFQIHVSVLFFYLFIFLVLPVYCYQPTSLHPRAHTLSHVIPWTSARQTPLSMDFSRQEYWSGLPFPSPVLFFKKQADFQVVACKPLKQPMNTSKKELCTTCLPAFPDG